MRRKHRHIGRFAMCTNNGEESGAAAESSSQFGGNSITDTVPSTTSLSAAASPSSKLYELLSPIPSCNTDQMSPAALAYIGDNVFELFIRCRYVWPNRRMSSLQDQVVKVVRAEMQAEILARMYQSTEIYLTNKERQVLTRGRNAGGKSGRGSVYQDATALEALIGYCYVSYPDRCYDILSWIQRTLDELDIQQQ